MKVSAKMWHIFMCVHRKSECVCMVCLCILIASVNFIVHVYMYSCYCGESSSQVY